MPRRKKAEQGEGILDFFRTPKVAPEPPKPKPKRRNAIDEGTQSVPVLGDVAPEQLIHQAEKDVMRITEKLVKPVARQERRKRRLGIKNKPLATLTESKEEGEGLEFMKRKAGLLPPAVRSMLSKMGNEKITSIKIVRTPLSGMVKTLLNIVSLGQYQKAVKESPYDEMFHLALFLNNTYTTDKQSVITLTKSSPIQKNSEVFDLTVSKAITFNELFENGRKKMGDDKFSSYDAHLNNCQDFVLGLLDGLLTDGARAFIKQNADEVFKRMSSISERLAKFITDVGAVADRVIEGEGFEEEWIEIGRGLYQPVRIVRGGEIPDDVKKLAEAKFQLRKATEEYVKALPEKEKPQLLPDYTIIPEVKKHTKQKISSTNKKGMESWREFWSKACKGKKFPGGRKEINEFMKEQAKKYKEMKSKGK